MLTSQAY